MLHNRDLPLLAVFVTVVRKGSFTAAAKELGLAKSVVSEHVRTLEERCGVRLLERTTRALRLTQVGEQVMAAAAPVKDGLAHVDRAVEEHRDAPAGTLRVTSFHDLGSRVVAPAAARLARAHPELRVELICDDGQRDLVAEGFDVALRLGPMADSSHVMKKLGTEPEVIVAAPELASRFAHATRPSMLAGAPWVEHAQLARPRVWRFHDERGDEDEAHIEPRVVANTADGMRAFVLAGAGFAAIPLFLIESALDAGQVERVCPAWLRRRLSLYAVMPAGKPPARVRAFLAILREVMATSRSVR